jgi:hypothetical protein
MERCVITVADEDFWVRTDKLRIKMGKEFGRPPAATRANDAVHRWISEGTVQIVKTICKLACIIQRSSVKSVSPESSFVTQLVQMIYSLLY